MGLFSGVPRGCVYSCAEFRRRRRLENETNAQRAPSSRTFFSRAAAFPSTSSRDTMAKGRSTTPRRTPRSSTPRNTPRGTPRSIAAPETAPTPGPGAYDPWSHSDSKKSAKNFSERKASAAFKSASDTSLRRSGAHIREARDHVSYLRDMGDPGAYDPFAHMGIGTSHKSFNRSHQRGTGS